MMKILEALRYAASQLETVLKEPDESRQEAEILLQHFLGLNKLQLYIEPGLELKPEEKLKLNQCLNRRISLEPVQYILGCAEFFGLEFYVEPSVLIPRPESELLVEKVLEYAQEMRERPLLIADVGTGSGCLAVALAVNLPRSKILAVDISSDALKTAGRNVLKHNLSGRIELIQGDLLADLEIPEIDIVVANLPYIPLAEYERLSADMLKYEPAIALAGGHDGLMQIRRLLDRVSGNLKERGCLFLEVGIGQSNAVMEIARKSIAGASVEIFKDPGGVERVVKVSRL